MSHHQTNMKLSCT